MGRSGADAAANEDDTKRGSEAFRVLYDALRRDAMCFFFFFFLGFGFFPRRMGPWPKP